MLIRTLRLEKKAQKAYREDLSDSEERDMPFPKYFCEKWPELAKANQVVDDSDDVQYMGGSRDNRRSQNNRK